MSPVRVQAEARAPPSRRPGRMEEAREEMRRGPISRAEDQPQLKTTCRGQALGQAGIASTPPHHQGGLGAAASQRTVPRASLWTLHPSLVPSSSAGWRLRFLRSRGSAEPHTVWLLSSASWVCEMNSKPCGRFRADWSQMERWAQNAAFLTTGHLLVCSVPQPITGPGISVSARQRSP